MYKKTNSPGAEGEKKSFSFNPFGRRSCLVFLERCIRGLIEKGGCTKKNHPNVFRGVGWNMVPHTVFSLSSNIRIQ